MKVFIVNFFIFSLLFGVIYFLSIGRGAPGLEEQDFTLGHALGGMFTAALGFSFWITMLIDCFSSSNLRNRAAWGLGLIFFSWVAAIIYFFAVYRKSSD